MSRAIVAPVCRLADIDAAEQRLAARSELGAEGGHPVEVRAGLVLGGALVKVRVRGRVRDRVRVRDGVKARLVDDDAVPRALPRHTLTACYRHTTLTAYYRYTTLTVCYRYTPSACYRHTTLTACYRYTPLPSWLS